MARRIFLALLLTTILFLGGTAFVSAETPVSPPPAAGASAGPTAQNPFEMVNDFYRFALLVSGLLAFGTIVYAAIRYTVAAGNTHMQSDAKDQITQALLGLLLLVSAALILQTINPQLAILQIPELKRLKYEDVALIPPSAQITCQQAGAQCKPSDSVNLLFKCLNTLDDTDTPLPAGLPRKNYGAVANSIGIRPGETHAMGSCHFGGKNCKNDGSHAIDWGKNALEQSGSNSRTNPVPAITMQEMVTAAETCGLRIQSQIGASSNPVQCFYETPTGQRVSSPAGANHIHCNVDVAPRPGKPQGCDCH